MWAEDARLLGHAQNGMMRAAYQIEAIAATAKTAQKQRRVHMWAAVLGAFLGALVSSLTWLLSATQSMEEANQLEAKPSGARS